MARRSSLPSLWDEATNWQNLTPVWLPLDLPVPLARRRSSAADPSHQKDDSALHCERRESYCFGDQEAIVTWNTAALGLCVDGPEGCELEIDDVPRPALPCCYTCNFVLKRSGAPCGQRFAHILEFLNHLRFRHWATHWKMSDAELVRGGLPLEYCNELRRMIDVTLGRFPVEFELPNDHDSQ